MMMAGLDGITNKTEPALPVDKDLYELTPEESAEVAQTPASLEEVITRLEADHEYLTQGGVFTEDLIDTWIDIKRNQEIAPIHLRPHPYEFELYFDV
ncbi:Glutamate--ammonia ligase [Nocardia seriolae]|uniref:glutamine synthetase n=1 Tax=Nocardia seriolae TaxID=37332 RepID=A0ABC8AXI5_9NOCA|nr:Glutamate--ammonia ligase [Nocardia seriolae]